MKLCKCGRPVHREWGYCMICHNEIQRKSREKHAYSYASYHRAYYHTVKKLETQKDRQEKLRRVFEGKSNGRGIKKTGGRNI